MLIIVDTREKTGWWDLSKYDGCDGQISSKIDAGDYSLYDYPNLITIERKRTINEIANNLGREYERFCREFERMQKYKNKYVICEFTLDSLIDYPKNEPKYLQKSIRMNGKFMLKRIDELENKYNVKFIFCKNKEEAEREAFDLFKLAIAYSNLSKAS
jgi:hypothetical protein